MTKSVSEWFEGEWLDYALLVGMTPDEFWFGDPELFYSYEWAYRKKMEKQDIDIWQIGARVFEVFQSSPVVVGFATKDVVTKMKPYPPCPHKSQHEDTEYTAEEIEALRLREEIELTNWVKSFKKRK